MSDEPSYPGGGGARKANAMSTPNARAQTRTLSRSDRPKARRSRLHRNFGNFAAPDGAEGGEIPRRGGSRAEHRLHIGHRFSRNDALYGPYRGSPRPPA